MKLFQCAAAKLAIRNNLRSILQMRASHTTQNSIRSVHCAFAKWIRFTTLTTQREQFTATRRLKLQRILNSHAVVRRTLRCFQLWRFNCTVVVPAEHTAIKAVKLLVQRKTKLFVRIAFRKWVVNSGRRTIKLKMCRSVVNSWVRRSELQAFRHWLAHKNQVTSAEMNKIARHKRAQLLMLLSHTHNRYNRLKVYSRFQFWKLKTVCNKIIRNNNNTIQEYHSALETCENKLKEETELKAKSHSKYKSISANYKQQLITHKNIVFLKLISRLLSTSMLQYFYVWRSNSRLLSMETLHNNSTLALKTARVMRSVVIRMQQVKHSNVQLSFALWVTITTKLRALQTTRLDTEHKQAQKIFSQWSKLCRVKISKRKVMLHSINMLSKYQLYSAFQRFRVKTKQLHTLTITCTTIMNIKYKYLLRHSLSKWYKTIHHIKYTIEYDTRNNRDAEIRIEAMKLFLSKWRLYAVMTRNKQKIIQQLVVRKWNNVVRIAYNKWRRVARSYTAIMKFHAILLRLRSRKLSDHIRTAVAKWRTFVWGMNTVALAQLNKKLNRTLSSLSAIQTQQSNLEHTNSLFLHNNQQSALISRAFFNQVIRILANKRHVRSLVYSFKQWLLHHVLVKRVQKVVVFYAKKSTLFVRLCSLSHGLHHWIKVVKSTFTTNKWSVLLKSREILQNMRFYMYQWKQSNHTRRVITQSFVSRLHHLHSSACRRDVYVAFSKWKEHYVLEYNHWNAVVAKLFRLWSSNASARRRHRLQLTQLSNKVTAGFTKQILCRWHQLTVDCVGLRTACVQIVKFASHKQLQLDSRSVAKYFRKWYKVCVSEHSKLTLVARALQKCHKQILQSAVQKWTVLTRFSARKISFLKRLVVKNSVSQSQSQLFQSFNLWKHKDYVHKTSAIYNHHLCSILQDKMLRGVLRKSLLAWKIVSRSRALQLRILNAGIQSNINKAHYYANKLQTTMLHCTTPQDTIQCAVAAYQSFLPDFHVAVYYRMHDNYLWGLASNHQSSGVKSSGVLGSSSSKVDREVAYNTGVNSRSSSPVRFSQHAREYRNNREGGGNNNNIHHNSSFVHNDLSRVDSASPLTMFSSPSPVKLSSQSQPHSAMRSPLKIDTAAMRRDTVRQQAEDGPHTFNSNSELTYNTVLRPSDAHSTVIFGEGVVGRCARNMHHTVYRQPPVTSSATNSATSTSKPNLLLNTAVKAQEKLAATIDKDVLTVVIPIIYNASVVGVIQLTAIAAEQTGLFFDNLPGIAASNEQKRGDNGAHSIASKLGTGHSDSMLGASLMISEVYQVCMEINIPEAVAIGLLMLSCAVSETFAQYYARDTEQVTSGHHSPTYTSSGGILHPDSLPPYATSLHTPNTVDSIRSYSVIGLTQQMESRLLSMRQFESRIVATREEVMGLNTIIERLQKSRTKYMHKAEGLAVTLQVTKKSLAEEMEQNTKLQTVVTQLQTQIRTFEEQEEEIEEMNNLMREVARNTLM